MLGSLPPRSSCFKRELYAEDFRQQVSRIRAEPYSIHQS